VIRPGAIGSSPHVRPFFARGASAPPVMAYTPLGGNTAFNAGGVATLTLVGVSIGASDTLLCAVAVDNAVNVDGTTVKLNGVSLAVDEAVFLFNASANGVALWSLRGNGSAVSGNLVADFSASTGEPTRAVILATKVSALLQSGSFIDQHAQANGTATTQGTAATAATTHAVDFAWGIIATNGNTGETVGAWQNGWTAGQLKGFPTGASLIIKEGYKLLAATGTQQARVTGATSRAFGAHTTVYKGA
jgi:hypothetical protein